MLPLDFILGLIDSIGVRRSIEKIDFIDKIGVRRSIEPARRRNKHSPRPFNSTSTSLNATELELLHPLTLTDTEHRVIPGMATRLGYLDTQMGLDTRLGLDPGLLDWAIRLGSQAGLGYSTGLFNLDACLANQLLGLLWILGL